MHRHHTTPILKPRAYRGGGGEGRGTGEEKGERGGEGRRKKGVRGEEREGRDVKREKK